MLSWFTNMGLENVLKKDDHDDTGRASEVTCQTLCSDLCNCHSSLRPKDCYCLCFIDEETVP